jgi:thioredoxin 1
MNIKLLLAILSFIGYTHPEVARSAAIPFESFFHHQAITPENSLALFDQQVIRNTQPVVLKISTQTCGPCKMIKRPFEALAQEYQNKIVFIEMDAHQFSAISSRLGVQYVPLILVYSQGNIQAKYMGASALNQLRTYLQAQTRT